MDYREINKTREQFNSGQWPQFLEMVEMQRARRRCDAEGATIMHKVKTVRNGGMLKLVSGTCNDKKKSVSIISKI